MRATRLLKWSGLVLSLLCAWSFSARANPERPRQPRNAAAFAIAPDLVITTADTVRDATRLILQGADGMPIEASLVKSDPVSGLALLRVTNAALTPLALGKTLSAGQMQCACFPAQSVFNPEIRVLDGQITAANKRFLASLPQHPRLSGSPLLRNGKVIGVILSTPTDDPGRLPVISVQDLRTFVADQARATDSPADPAASMLQLTVETQQ